MKSLSLYQEGDNLIYRVDPITKMFFVILAIVVPYILPSLTIASVSLAVCVLILSFARVLRKTIPLIGVSLLVLVSIALIQGLFYGDNATELFSLGPVVFYQEGLLYASKLCLRILVIICAFAILILTTKPSDLVESLIRKGMSPRIGYVLLSVLQIIPQMSSTMGTITDAQRSRGMETEGSLAIRLKAFFPLIGPVVMNSLTNTRERSMALEVRAFNSTHQRTYINEAEVASFNKIIRIVIFLVLVASIAWRVLG